MVQGAKSVQEVLASDFDVITLLGTTDFLSVAKYAGTTEVIEVTPKELEGLGEYQSNDSAFAVVRLKPNRPLQIDKGEFIIALDDIRDPGNLGTIIRTADWYGITRIVASEETADFYNAKVINSTMGSFTRVEVFYTDLVAYLGDVKSKVYGAFLDGQDVHTTDFSSGGYIVIGNESHGISPQVEKLVTDRITIPRYGKAESLNAAIATAVICDTIRCKNQKA